MRFSSLSLLGILAVCGCIAAPVRAADKPTGRDVYWTAPDVADHPVNSIALLPPVTYDGNADHRKLIEDALGRALKASGHRWASPFIVKDNLMRAGGDSLQKVLRDKLLADPRVDSLDAPFLARTLRVRALLSVRADQMERLQLEPNQSGRPSTTVHLRGALVDSTGRLLWTASSIETAEGQRQEAGGNIIGVKASGLNNTAVGLTTSAPAFDEVLARVAQRWLVAFPQRPRPAGADSARTAP